jgi:hypothetical protein
VFFIFAYLHQKHDYKSDIKWADVLQFLQVSFVKGYFEACLINVISLMKLQKIFWKVNAFICIFWQL